MTSIDLSEFKALSAGLGRASAAMVAAERAVVAKAAVNIKKDARSRVSDDPRWRRLEPTLNYDIFGLNAIVGYEDSGQGELASIAEYGSSRHAPHPALLPAAQAEAPRFEKATLAVALKVVEDAL